MDPYHRDRLAFVKIVSGTFKRNTPYLHVRNKKKLKFSSPNAFFAERKEILKNQPLMLAKRIQSAELVQQNSQIAQKVIDRATPKKQEISGPEGKPLSITFEGVPSAGK